jgi:hypothetical protein
MKRFFVRLLCLLTICAHADTDPLIVHEWGTFTSLQDETGRTIGGINSDDEPVPKFVHDLNRLLILRPDQLPPVCYQGAPRCHPDVTMRLETPVIYFHLPDEVAKPLAVDVKVAWRGGWLTQFYPDAQAKAPGAFGALDDKTTGRLTWRNLSVGSDAGGPTTTEHVWTAPRAVKATPVTTPNGESERYLFYRGVGHLNAPLRVARMNGQLRLRSQLESGFAGPLKIQKLWLAQFRSNGECAFRSLDPATLGGDSEKILLTTSATFADREFGVDNLARLRSLMRQALVEDGLFADESNALLNTWELSYFKSAGLRLFFLLSREWTDHYLPLELSVPAKVSRVMVGRIELVTPEHRHLLREIAEAPIPTRPWAGFANDNGKPEITGAMPPAYHDLGRFRNALVLDELNGRPTESLSAFIRINGLQFSSR